MSLRTPEPLDRDQAWAEKFAALEQQMHQLESRYTQSISGSLPEGWSYEYGLVVAAPFGGVNQYTTATAKLAKAAKSTVYWQGLGFVDGSSVAPAVYLENGNLAEGFFVLYSLFGVPGAGPKPGLMWTAIHD